MQKELYNDLYKKKHKVPPNTSQDQKVNLSTANKISIKVPSALFQMNSTASKVRQIYLLSMLTIDATLYGLNITLNKAISS